MRQDFLKSMGGDIEINHQVRFLLCHWSEREPLPLREHTLICVGREDGLADGGDHAGWVVL